MMYSPYGASATKSSGRTRRLRLSCFAIVTKCAIMGFSHTGVRRVKLIQLLQANEAEFPHPLSTSRHEVFGQWAALDRSQSLDDALGIEFGSLGIGMGMFVTEKLLHRFRPQLLVAPRDQVIEVD